MEEILQEHLDTSRFFFENAFLNRSVSAFLFPSPIFPLNHWLWTYHFTVYYIKLGLNLLVQSSINNTADSDGEGMGKIDN